MKNSYLLLFSLLILITTGCSTETKQTGDPGNIPGMGETPGEAEVNDELFLPDGVVIDGDITGSSDPIFTYNSPDGCLNGHQAGQTERCEHGSGGADVALNITFVNTTDENKNVVIPAGCIFNCKQEGYQNAILIQDVAIKLIGRGAVSIKLNVYCINRGREGSSNDLTYELKGITTSEHMLDLIDNLIDKKIDIVFYNEDQTEYQSIISGIQDVVWAITNDSGVSEDGWNFIFSLPEM
ncbi:hypothetical protein [Carboxylicivirga linearis]|uniref:Uncharacterized protein n=1 Tax=Carboxylicivirga linearis TaxID=1628157 RepID=A0ABS5K0Y8_9BACT|nr:hypothetical protein [Carboxylicivirga linearis]MBS2100359.1 hypothetical protein [Carboxylicivirga linearis]